MKNEVNRALVAKKATRYLFLGLLMTLALNVSARVFGTGEILYVKTHPANWGWYGDNSNDGKFAYFFNSNTDAGQWSEELIGVDYTNSEVLQVTVPAGDWTHVIMTRNSVHSNPSWDNVYNDKDYNNANKSANIEIPADQNYLENFRQLKDADEHPTDKWYWMDHYFYRPSVNPSSASVTKIDQADREVINVCTQSSGDPYSLQPRIVDNNYDYNQGRTWFKWDGNKWKELEHANHEWGFNGPGRLNETIGAANSHTYYFLATADHSKERFIEIAVTQDCSPTCEITDFGVVTSNVNAHDSTYVLDGIVAFKDATGKTLRISVTDAKGEHHIDYDNPTTPWLFSLPDLYADGTTGLVATATFLGTSYSRNSNSYDAPNAIIGINTTNIDNSYVNAATLTPSTPGTDGFKWHDGNTTDHVRTIPAYDYDTTIIYTYYEYEEPPTVAGNLIENGDFSSAASFYGAINHTNNITGSAISQYNFWGMDVTDDSNFYDTYTDPATSSALSGGFSVVKDANKFWKRFTKKIAPKKNTHYALFDADSTGTKKAWYISTAKSSKLTLAKGTNYMFSFWVANINNYGEMNNAAKLQFAIRYKQGGSWSAEVLLGSPIDLNKYQDNIWHQNSHVFTSPVDATEVEIMVRDLNDSKNPGGNDFALDDIQFQPISVVSQAIKNCERFVVTFFEPAITVNQPVITLTKTPACDTTDFAMQVQVSYSALDNTFPVTLQLTDNIYGDIFATPIPIDPIANPTSITLDLSSSTYAMLVADGAVHTLTATITRINGAGVDKGGSNSNTYTSPGIPAIKTPVLTIQEPSCNKTTFDIEVATEYCAFKGTQLLYEWDGVEWQNADKPTLSYKETTWQPANGKLKDLPADGLNHTLRVYSDNDVLDCDYTFAVVAAPATPSIDTANVAFSTPGCTDLYTTLSFHLRYTYQQGKIHYSLSGMTEDSVRAITTDKAEQTLDLVYEGIPANGQARTLHVWFDGANSCDSTFQLPATPFSPVINAVTATKDQDQLMCGEDSFDVHVTITVPYVDPAGRRIELSFADSVIYVNATAATNQVDLRLHVYDAPIAFTATYPQTDCPVSSEPLASPIATPCEIYYDTICLGEPYNEHGFDIDNTLPVGTHYFKNAIGEELYLTVADAKDMYSKWTDVLFISNPNGQYVAYQWFKNGQPMQGETLQRLYDPNGMAGTNDLYHCQMTLVDGSVITTCPQTFDQTQRSAEASKNGNNQQQVIRRYRVSEHVYIIQTICGDRVETQKIFTSYE